MEKDKKKLRNWNSVFLELIGTRPILFNPLLAKISKSTEGGILMSQMLYWQSAMGNDIWFYKTIDDFELETTLTRRQQEKGLKFWVEYEIIKTERRGVPAKRWFKVDIARMLGMINTHCNRKISIKKNGKTVTPNFGWDDSTVCTSTPN